MSLYSQRSSLEIQPFHKEKHNWKGESGEGVVDELVEPQVRDLGHRASQSKLGCSAPRSKGSARVSSGTRCPAPKGERSAQPPPFSRLLPGSRGHSSLLSLILHILPFSGPAPLQHRSMATRPIVSRLPRPLLRSEGGPPSFGRRRFSPYLSSGR